VFRGFGPLPAEAIVKGLIVGSSRRAGSYLAKPFVLSLPPERFRLLMEGLMLVSGTAMIVSALA